MEKAWRDLNLSKRTKASLSAKWRDIKNKTPTRVTTKDQKKSQESTDDVQPNVTSDTAIVTVAHKVDSSSISVNTKTISQPHGIVDALVDNTAVVDIKNIFYKNLKISKKLGCKPNSRKAPHRVSGGMFQPVITESR